MSDLGGLPNIGAKLALELTASGIETHEQMKELGSLELALRLNLIVDSVCRSKLYALEGAIRGVRWHDIPSEERAALWNAFVELRDAS